jgi:carbon monoxide dehydrogenase subunit G
MELNGDILINADRQKVWESLNDTQVLMRSIPGCESMEEVGPYERTASVKVKVGPVRARFAGRVRMQDVNEGQGCTLVFEGSGGAAGMAKGQSSVALSDEDGGTRLAYTVQASVGGKLGQIGGRMIDAAAKQMADQFFAAFQQEISGDNAQARGAQVQAPNTTAKSPAASAGTQQATAAAVAPASPASQPVPDNPVRTLTNNSHPVPSQQASPEQVRILWFVLGALSTGFGVWIAHIFS